MSHRIFVNNQDNSGSLYDAVDARDINGNGDSIVYAEETGPIKILLRTAATTYSGPHTIQAGVHGGTGAYEGLCIADIDDSGNYVVFAMLQSATTPAIHLFVPDTPGDYDGTWTRTVLFSSYPDLQGCRAIDLDGDGKEELMFAHEIAISGAAGDEAGIRWADFDGADYTDPADWTVYQAIAHNRAWFLAPTLQTINGDANSMLYVAKQTPTVGGVYYIKKPTTVTDLWTRTTVYADNNVKQWNHAATGNFFGNADDVVAHNNDGDLSIFNSASSWAKTDITTADLTACRFNCLAAPWTRNGRTGIITSGDSRVAIWEWDGATWQRNDEGRNWGKSDNKSFIADFDGDGQPELLLVNTATVAWFDLYEQSATASWSDNLVAFWRMQETPSGNRTDEQNALVLVQNGTIDTAASSFGDLAANFTVAGGDYFTLADQALISMGTSQSFTLAALVYLTTLNNKSFVRKDSALTAANCEYVLRMDNSEAIRMAISNGTTFTELTDLNSSAMTTSTWYLVIGGYDADNKVVWCQLNGNIPTGREITSGAQDSNKTLHVGGNNGAANMDGRIARTWIWKRRLNDEERRALYNAGSFLDVPVIGVGSIVPILMQQMAA